MEGNWWDWCPARSLRDFQRPGAFISPWAQMRQKVWKDTEPAHLITLMLRTEQAEREASVGRLENEWFLKACKSWLRGDEPHAAYLEDHGHDSDFYGNPLPKEAV